MADEERLPVFDVERGCDVTPTGSSREQPPRDSDWKASEAKPQPEAATATAGAGQGPGIVSSSSGPAGFRMSPRHNPLDTAGEAKEGNENAKPPVLRSTSDFSPRHSAPLPAGQASQPSWTPFIATGGGGGSASSRAAAPAAAVAGEAVRHSSLTAQCRKLWPESLYTRRGVRGRFMASMLLAAVGDTLGYFNGHFEFAKSGDRIMQEVLSIVGTGPLTAFRPKRNLMVSDDTVLLLSTAEGIVEGECTARRAGASFTAPHPQYGYKYLADHVFPIVAKHLKTGMKDMAHRAPGQTTIQHLALIHPDGRNWEVVPYNSRGAGCGVSMRAMAIGLRYAAPSRVKELLALAVESGRMSHHNGLGYLGGFASALFTAFAIQQ
ncbi:Adprh, partial [Symbiodinium sp. KB8]